MAESGEKREQAEEQYEERMQQKLARHVNAYPISLIFPARVAAVDAEEEGDSKRSVARTSSEFVNHRLLECGVVFDDEAQTLGELSRRVTAFVEELHGTACYDSVQVLLGESGRQQRIDVLLAEKKWYKLYVGGGVKHDGLVSNSSALLPKLQFETTASLLNLTGHADKTTASYAVDQTGASTLAFAHDRPLYTLFPPYSPLYNFILTEQKLGNGSKMGVLFRAFIDTLDHEHTSSCKEHQRRVGIRFTNNGTTERPEMSRGFYKGLEWNAVWRDLLPRRHASIPYHADASKQILAQAGSSLKTSILYQSRMNNSRCDDRYNPTIGYDAHWGIELAGPPGDVGFIKGDGGLAVHIPITASSDDSTDEQNTHNNQWYSGLSFHGILNGGLIRPLAYRGLCPGTTSVLDRFFVGGTNHLRGFLPAGIGPRASTGGASTPGGDALGGDLYYTATAALSLPFPCIPFLRDNGVRLMAFANTGTLTAFDSISFGSFLRSSRVSVGGGISMGTKMGRLEATYALPTRCGPRDALRSVQAGLGFAFE